MKSYRTPKAEIKPSPIHGRGLFAKKPIKKGEIAGIRTGHIVDKKIFEKSAIKGSEAQIAENFYLVALTPQEYEDTLLFVNHSCQPNLGFKGDVVLVSLRDIKKGEELTADYSTCISDIYFHLLCNCGEANCRKIIRGDDWKKKEIQNKYGNYFSTYLLEKMRKLKYE